MIAYTFPFLYYFLIEFFSINYKCLEIEKKYIQYYNIFLSTISGILFFNSAIELYKSNFYDVLCINYINDLNLTRYTFLLLKFVEWFDSLLLLKKYEGNKNKINNLHYYHHAIVPTMTYYGLFQPGEIYVLVSNNLAHFLMYAYYAFPKLLNSYKNYITKYQYIQHFFALTLIIWQYTSKCKINYPVINIIGYIYFFYEYLKLVLKTQTNIKMNALSSFLFLINVFYLWDKNDTVYLYSFISLFLSSVLYHQTNNKTLKIIDKIFTYNVIYQGYKRLIFEFDMYLMITLICFLSCAYLYVGGYIKSKYSFDKNKQKSEFYHIFVHLCACIGHNTIIAKLE